MRSLILIGSAILLMGAGSPDPGSTPEFGASVRHNVVVQTVDMNPKYDGALMEGGVGTRSVAAVKRYQDGKIRPLAKVDGSAAVGSQGGAAATQN